MRGTQQREIHRHRPRRAQRRHLALLQHAQQARLQRQRHVADLVQEQHAPMRLPQQPLAALAARAGEGPVFIAEEFGFDQTFRQRRAVHRHERPGRAPAARMHLAREHFLARAGFALQQNGDAGIHQVHSSTQRVQRRRVQADCGRRGRGGSRLAAFRRRQGTRRGRRRQAQPRVIDGAVARLHPARGIGRVRQRVFEQVFMAIHAQRRGREFQRPQRQPVGPDQQVAPEGQQRLPGAPSPAGSACRRSTVSRSCACANRRCSIWSTAARTRASASGRMPPAWLDRSSTPRIRPWLSHTGTAAQVRMRFGSK